MQLYLLVLALTGLKCGDADVLQPGGVYLRLERSELTLCSSG
jgi:hypothetical protein